MDKPSKRVKGSLLVAYPGMLDPNFRRTVVLIVEHSKAQGSLGFVVNRPLGESLSKYIEGDLHAALGRIALYEGGPVERQRVILAAWRHRDGSQQMYLDYNLEADEAASMAIEDPTSLIAFAGHSGWSDGQLEGELEQNTWAISRVTPAIANPDQGEDLWRDLIFKQGEEFRPLVYAPDFPSLN